MAVKGWTCKQTEKQIPAFLEDRMDRRQERLFLEHIDGCPSCKEELSIQFLVTTGLKRLENGDNFDLNRELAGKIRQEKRHLQVLDSLQSWQFAIEAAAMAAAVMVFLLVR